MGAYSLYVIPKESAPDIKLSMISISTVYPWVSPQDIDSLITTKIEDELSNIDGVDKITSHSYLSVSSIVMIFENDVDMTKTLVKVKDVVDKVSLPEDARTPVVQEVNTANTLMFNAVFFSKDKNMSLLYLKERIRELKNVLEGQGAIDKIDFDVEGKGTIAGNMWVSSKYYELQVLLDKWRMQELGITIQNVQQTIQAWNMNRPLGNYRVWDLNYDFRIQWEIKHLDAVKKIPITTPQGIVDLGDIAQIKKVLTKDEVSKMGVYQWGPFDYITLGIHKAKGADIFASEQQAKQQLHHELQKTKYSGIDYVSVYDLGDVIIEDYDQLAKNMLQTFIFVFVSLLIFIGFKESLIATISLPLAFFITFIVLNQLGLTLNFLTNFSLIVTLGIAIDTTIVVIEWAHERMRQWFNPKHAILLAVRDYKMPLITGTATTVLVFVPMMLLPGTMGKFLAYIPITIFITLLAALFISMTINSALYYKLSKKGKYYETDIGDQDFMLPEVKALLEQDRIGKTVKEKETQLSKREKIFDRISMRYSLNLSRVMKNARTRLLAIVVPLVALIVSVVFISPNLGFEMMPHKDYGRLQARITSKEWTDQKVMEKYIQDISDVLSSLSELKSYYTKIKNGTIDINIELTHTEERARKNLMSDVETARVIEEKLKYLRSEGLDFAVEVSQESSMGAKDVGIKLIADSTNKIDDLIKTAKNLEHQIKQIPHLENVTLSSQDTPWTFVYTLDREKLKLLGVSPLQINVQMYAIMNSLSAGSIKDRYDDNDIKVLYQEYGNEKLVSPSTINSIEVLTPTGEVNFGDISSYKLTRDLSSLDREDGKVVIKIEADSDGDLTPDVLQKQAEKIAATYHYPQGISYDAGWETAENSDLLLALISSFVIALLVIFAILLLQFNSYSQPMVIMYSIAMGLLGANIWLLLFWLPYSMMFLIGFIALTGVIVNDSIVFIDRINNNLSKGMTRDYATSEAGRARLQPILLTTITTVLWLLSILPDGMWKPLAVTMMFGMLFGSTSTLFVTPALYYDIDKFKYLIKKNILSIIILVLPLIAIYGAMLILGYYLDIALLGTMGGKVVVVLLMLWYLGWYFWDTIQRIHTTGSSRIQKILGFQLLSEDGKFLSKKKIILKILVTIAMYVGPLVLWWIAAVLTGSTMGFVGVTLLLYFLIQILIVYGVRTSPKEQTLVERKLWVCIVRKKLQE